MFPDLTRDDVFIIGTERLWLRWPRLADAEQLAVTGGHPDVARWTASWPIHCDADFARERIVKQRARNAAGTALTFAITERAQWSRAIGLIGISVDDNGTSGSLGYHLAPEHWERGYTSEAIEGLVSMTRMLTRLKVIRAGVIPGNGASVRVLEKNGFVSTGWSLFDSPIRGPIDVIGFERRLRPSRVAPTTKVRALEAA